MDRRTRRLLRKLKETPGIKWKNEITPVTPNVAGTTRITKAKNKSFRRKKRSKKPAEPVEMPEPSALQEYINSLEEYEQGRPTPATLDDFIPEEVKRVLLGAKDVEEIEEILDAIEEFTDVQTESCHRVTVSGDSGEDKGECAVIHMGSDSEEELRFPDDEEEPSKESTEEECLFNLRHGKWYPERQAPKEKKKKTFQMKTKA